MRDERLLGNWEIGKSMFHKHYPWQQSTTDCHQPPPPPPPPPPPQTYVKTQVEQTRTILQTRSANQPAWITPWNYPGRLVFTDVFSITCQVLKYLFNTYNAFVYYSMSIVVSCMSVIYLFCAVCYRFVYAVFIGFY